MRVKFGDIVKDVKENVDRSNNPYKFYVAGDHMDSEDFRIHRFGRFATDDVGPAFVRIFHPGQILYGSRRTYLKKVCVADFEGITANTTFVLETKDETVLMQKLLPFLMLSKGFTDWSIKHSKGSTNPYVLFSDLASYEFDLPPLERQKELAELLWAANDLKESYKKMIAATDEMLKAKFREMFGRAEPQSRREGEKPQIDADSRRSGGMDSHVKKRSGGGNIALVKIGDVFETCAGGTPLTKHKEYYDGGTIPWMNSGEVAQGIITSVEGRITELGLSKSAAKMVPVDSVVVAMYGATAGKVGLLKIETSTNQAVCAILPNERAVPDYLYFALTEKYDYMVTNAKGGAQPNISQAFIREMKIPLPPLALQQEFVEIARKADETKASLKKSIADVDVVIKGLING